MPQKSRPNSTWYLGLVGVVALVVVGGLISLRPYGRPLNWGIRGAALLGYLFIFFAIVSSAYMRRLVRIFGRPFIKVHHALSVTGLILLTLHPLGVALQSASLHVFLPQFDSWSVFLQLGGRPAWYLIGVASLAAALRKTLGQRWRLIHFLNYIAFLLGTVHAFMIGTDFQHIAVRITSAVMILVVAAVFVQKRSGK